MEAQKGAEKAPMGDARGAGADALRRLDARANMATARAMSSDDIPTTPGIHGNVDAEIYFTTLEDDGNVEAEILVTTLEDDVNVEAGTHGVAIVVVEHLTDIA